MFCGKKLDWKVFRNLKWTLNLSTVKRLFTFIAKYTSTQSIIINQIKNKIIIKKQKLLKINHLQYFPLKPSASASPASAAFFKSSQALLSLIFNFSTPRR